MVKNKSFTTLGYITKDFGDAADDSFWAIASVEVPDAVGDVIWIDGIDTTKYHQPPQRYIKILAGHEYMLSDGTPAIVGRVEEFKVGTVQTADGPRKALAFRMSYAKNPDGSLTELASKYKPLFDSGYLDSFSVGFTASVADCKSNKTGGLDIQKINLHEISAVAIPCNHEANALKAVKDALGTDIADAIKVLMARKEANEEVDEVVEEEKSTEEATEPCSSNVPVEELKSMLTLVLKSTNELVVANKSLQDRLDVMESALVVLTDTAKAQVSVPPNKDEPDPERQKFLSTLTRLNKFLDA